MINKINKIAALTILSGVVVSIIPSQTVSAKVRLNTLNGTFNSAQAFDDGKYIFNGYKTDNMNAGIYYFDGEQDKTLNDINGIFKAYGENYVSTDEYGTLIDLNDGTITDEDDSDRQNKVQRKLKNTIVRDNDKYSDFQNIVYVDNIKNNGFSKEWFEFKLENQDKTSEYILYIDEDGNYIDASEKLNITHTLKDGTKVKLNSAQDLKEKGYKAEYQKAFLCDENYIYRLVTITNSNDSEDKEKFIQKISKKSAETKDSACIPSEVKSYKLEEDFNTDLDIAVKNNSIYTIKVEDSKTFITKYDFVFKDRTDKLILDDDYKVLNNQKIDDYDIDSKNNIWILQNGNISKVEDDKLDTMYAVDTQMDKLSVYDEGDIIAWNAENNIYSSVGGTALRAGWTQYKDGSWVYLRESGERVKGWLTVNDETYYLNENGIMQTGWYLENNLWYYLDQSGKLLKNTVVDGYKIGNKGFWVK